MSNELSIAEECSSTVVVGVKECEGLLLQDEEEGVDKFNILGNVVQLRLSTNVPWVTRTTYVIECDQLFCPASVVTAYSVENTTSDQGGQQLFDEKNQQSSADSGEEEVMEHEEAVQCEGFAVFHQFSSSEDNDIV